VRNVGAADVERPGGGVRIRYDQRVGAKSCQLGPNAGELFCGGFAGEAQSMQRDRAKGRGGAVGPNGVDQIRLDRDQLRAGGGASLAKPLGALDAVQPRIVAEPVARREMLLDPSVGRRLDQMLDGKQRRIHLLARLQRVAAIDEKHGALHQNDGDTGRTGEAGQPGEASLRGGHVFILVAVGARHDESGQAAPRQFRAQRREARCAGRAFGPVLE